MLLGYEYFLLELGAFYPAGMYLSNQKSVVEVVHA